MLKKLRFPKAKEADVALILEGSYPFVSGGLSTWMHQVITAFPDISFAIIFLGSRPEDYDKPKYVLPKNVVHLDVRYLFSRKHSNSNHLTKKTTKNKYMKYLSQWLKDKSNKAEGDLDFFLDLETSDDWRDFYKTSASWNHVVDKYINYCTDPSFVNYFWTTFGLQSPAWEIMSILQDFIKVKVVHSACTGYAGLLGALINRHYKYPLVLSEHGIYTRERRIELWQQRIEARKDASEYFSKEMNYLQNLWIRFFELLSTLTYETANPIISLYQGARNIQIEEGADPKKTLIIPNGVDVDHLKKFRRKSSQKIPEVICFIGRIAPIKDLKTFIFAVNILAKTKPNIQGHIIGSAVESPEYEKECRNLISILGIEKNIFFKGWQNIDDFLPSVGALVLTSISEGMPLIVLENFAAGIPAIVTNVGACRELIEGTTEEDKKLGKAGEVVTIADPQAVANAVLDLIYNEKNWHKASTAAIKRVEKYYDQKLMFKRYQDIYSKMINGNKD